MRSNVVRILGAAAAVALAVVLLVVLKDDGDTPSDNKSITTQSAAMKPHEEEIPADAEGKQPVEKELTVPMIVIHNGKPVGGIAELSFQAGDNAAFKVRSDVSDELHLHGYDISKEIKAGGTATFNFPAEIEGIFELELEQRAEPIAELQVNP